MCAMAHDTISFEILEDGTIKFSTEAIGPKNHASADQLLKEIQEAMGGEVKIISRKKHHHHGNMTHSHDHDHDHHTH